MIRKSVSALLLLALVASAASAVWAADKMTIYIRNKPYKGKAMFRSGLLFLPLKSLVTALDLTVTRQGSTWCVADPAHKEAKGVEVDSGVCVNGLAVSKTVLDTGGETWVAVQPVIKALGGVYLENKSLGMIDIGLKYVAPPTSALDPQPGEASYGARPIMVHWFASW